ncbi:MAG: BspA family leucine-rich repeat surface protein [Oscillospiraceae bacterium]|nr:BspA family leucine-rich repeat surface protein [Oscillospiraceae bacterium]
MKRKLWAIALVLSLVAALVPAGFGAGAEATVTAYGTVTENGSNLPWQYSDGTLTIGGGFLNWNDIWNSPWNSIPGSVLRIVFTDPIVGGSYLDGLFAGFQNLSEIEGLDYIDTSNVESMRSMFRSTRHLTNLDLSGWDVSNVIDMGSMFFWSFGLINLDTSGWDTRKVQDMSGMFSGSGVTNIEGLTDWDTSNVKIMSGMFSGTNNLTSLDLSSWSVSNVTNMSRMFAGSDGLTHLNLYDWDTGNVMDMSEMFSNAWNLENIEGISDWDTSNVNEMGSMFAGASNLTSLDLSGWDTSSVWDMAGPELPVAGGGSSGEGLGMFSSTSSLNRLALGENFNFVWSRFGDANLPFVPQTYEFTGYWQNVGNGTVDNPQGEFVFTSAELMRYYDGSIHADTWVWQPAIKVYLNDERLMFDVAPIIENDRTLVPFRAIFEALGMEIEWDNDTRTAIGAKYGVRIEIPIDSTTALVNGDPVTLDVAAMLYNERTMVPLRFVAEATGASVEWVAYRRTVVITFVPSRTPVPPAEIEIPYGLTEAVVARVIDGDTIVLENGERVRFIGVDAPEVGEPGADEATEFVRELIGGQIIWLEADGNDTDRFGRLRRYVWLRIPTDTQCEDQIRAYMLNALLLENGLADVLIIGEVRNEALFREIARN